NARKNTCEVSPKRERADRSSLSRARRLGVTDHALHGREGAPQRALDLVDILVNLDHAHRRRGATMKIHDLPGIGVAHPDIVDVMDRAIGGKARPPPPDLL